MRWTVTALGGLALVACATAGFEGTPIAEWAGAYGNEEAIVREPAPGNDRKNFIPTFYGVVENILEIRPTGPTRARVDIRLYYPRGHQCGVTAEADLKDGRLVLDANSEDGPCQLFVTREKNRDGEDVLAVWENKEVSKACYIYCGANARLSASIPVSSRHAAPKTPVTQLDE
jgi:hypothetical protein